eukprot:CAMPEP_0174744128 /NCGR_PEP_ID=MMETSP1094-20130205/83408_1 /TAXON_ID=156173 /ORGANISM="Chrysochromulina brevifilum, Strain UTEX LB 985" /LENGTH=57 /DNA_ID=CAMNT_0015948445 /DNA_START=149 /DNA_END=319 /DNA_ORIENTATION=+
MASASAAATTAEVTAAESTPDRVDGSAIRACFSAFTAATTGCEALRPPPIGEGFCPL